MRAPVSRLNRSFAAALFVLLAAMATPAAGMTFALGAEGDCALRTCVMASGEIGERSADEFKAFVQRHHVRQGSLVVLDSGGGIVGQGLELGAYIRKQGFSTHVQGPSGSCASACVYAYLGGLQRTVSGGARLGVHQMSQTAGVLCADSADSQTVLSRIAVHVQRMGATLEVLTVALRVPPQQVYWLSGAELARFHVTTA